MNLLRQTYVREPEGVKLFLYDFFCKAARDNRIDELTYDEIQAEIKAKFKDYEFKPEIFESYKSVWIRREHQQ